MAILTVFFQMLSLLIMIGAGCQLLNPENGFEDARA